MGKPEYFWWIVGFTNVWKSMGWNSIIYLAAITSIDPALYEAAAIDGTAVSAGCGTLLCRASNPPLSYCL